MRLSRLSPLVPALLLWGCTSAEPRDDQDPVQAAGSGAEEVAGKAGRAGEGGSEPGRAGAPAAGKGGSAGHAAAGKGGTPAAGSGGAGKAGTPAAGSGGAGTAGSTAAGGTGGAAALGGEGAACGARKNLLCDAMFFCDYAPDDACGSEGVCRAKTDICDDLYAPVCGCDDRTYANDCYAHRDGVSVQRSGMCGPDECSAAGGHIVTSDGASTPECASGEDSWRISGGREATLCCVTPARNGKTCGGIAALSCGPQEFCNYEKSAGGDGCDGTVADAGGKCQMITKACTREYQPVCGCDHKTYSTACVAHSMGMSVLHDGSCTESDCKAQGGRVAFGTGPGPMCEANEQEYTSVIGDDGQIPIEGALCCTPR